MGADRACRWGSSADRKNDQEDAQPGPSLAESALATLARWVGYYRKECFCIFFFFLTMEKG